MRVRVGLVQLSRHTETCMVHLGSRLRGSYARKAAEVRQIRSELEMEES